MEPTTYLNPIVHYIRIFAALVAIALLVYVLVRSTKYSNAVIFMSLPL
jgi:hypothetical protein